MRVANWNLKFVEEIQRLRKDPSLVQFAWVPPNTTALEAAPVDQKIRANFHCLSFASHMVEIVTGRDYYTELASHLDYNEPKSALKALKTLGYDSVEGLIRDKFEPRRLSRVIRGDLALVPSDLEGMRLAIAVADPPKFWVIHSDQGLCWGNMSSVVEAFVVD